MPEGDNSNVDDLLKNLNLTQEQLVKVKADSEVLTILTHNITAKRDANQEAKTFREKLEALEKEKADVNKAELEKQGEFKKLYEESIAKLAEKDAKMKDQTIATELKLKFAQEGLKNNDYLKLFDKAELKIDDDLNITNLDEKVKLFKEKYPDFFKEAEKSKPNVDSSRPGVKSQVDETDELKLLKANAEKTKLPRDLAKYMTKLRELKK